MMTVEEGLEFAEQLVKSKHLNRTQILIFKRSWEGKAYKDIAKETGHTPDHIKNIGSDLWKSFSEALGTKVTKHNFATILQRYYRPHSCLYGCQYAATVDELVTAQQQPFGIECPFGSQFHNLRTNSTCVRTTSSASERLPRCTRK